MREYYNMHYKTHFLLNGKALKQEEAWKPELTSMEIGVEVKILVDRLFTGCVRVLICTIEYVGGKCSEG
jgi:hypothetical protein